MSGARTAQLLLLLLLGAAIAAQGAVLLRRSVETDALIAAAAAMRDGADHPAKAALDRDIAGLEAAVRSSSSGEEMASLAFLYYGAADEAAQRHASQEWKQDLLATRAAARRALGEAPARGDVALVLAEVELLLGMPQAEVEALLGLSFLTAPYEMWVAERRIGLGFRLLPTAPPELRDHILGDVRMLGKPFHDTDQYRMLARAAFVAGPVATAMVREELASIHPQPLQLFSEDLAALIAQSRPAGR